MKNKIIKFLRKLITRYEIKSNQLRNAAQGNTAALSAKLVDADIATIFQSIAAINELNESENIGIILRTHLIAAIDILFRERSRIRLIVEIAPVETHIQAQENNNGSLAEALLLLGELQQKEELPLPDLYKNGEEKDFFIKPNTRIYALTRLWSQKRVILDEEIILLKINHDNYHEDLRLLEILARALLQSIKLQTISQQIDTLNQDVRYRSKL